MMEDPKSAANPDVTHVEHVTVVEDSGRSRGGSGGGMMLALLALVLIAAVAFWMVTQNKSGAAKDRSVAAAADKVGNAADKIGNAAEDAVKKID